MSSILIKEVKMDLKNAKGLQDCLRGIPQLSGEHGARQLKAVEKEAGCSVSPGTDADYGGYYGHRVCERAECQRHGHP